MIPAISDDVSPTRYTYPFEMLPVSCQIVEGTECIRPLSQIAIEGMIVAGVEQIVMPVNEHKMEVMRYYRNGTQIGIPISYVFDGYAGFVNAINSCYHVIRGARVVMVAPGITKASIVSTVVQYHIKNKADVTLSVSQNTKVNAESGIVAVTHGQMSGVFVWEPAFTELLRERTIEQRESSTISFQEMITHAIDAEMNVKAVKLPYSQFVNDASSWSKAVTMLKQQENMLIDGIDED